MNAALMNEESLEALIVKQMVDVGWKQGIISPGSPLSTRETGRRIVQLKLRAGRAAARWVPAGDPAERR